MMCCIIFTQLYINTLLPITYIIYADNIWLTPAFQGKKIGYEAVYHVLSRLFKLGM